MKVAVIGGAGFIGTRLVERLCGAHQVKILDKADSAAFPALAVRVDVCDADAIARELAGHDAVVHLAAEHRDDVTPSSRYYDVNVAGTVNVLAALRRHAIRNLVFTSTVAVYGLDRPEADEDSPLDPFGHYGLSKREAEDAMRAWQAEDGARRLTIVRPTVVFGEANRGNVFNLLHQLASGSFLMVGDGANKKSMSYVENVADFLRFALESSDGGYRLFNYADKPDLEMNELVALVRAELGRSRHMLRIPYALGMLGGHAVDLVARLSGRSLPISAVRVQKFCATTVFSSERARRSGFTAKVALAEALRRTIAHEFGRGGD